MPFAQNAYRQLASVRNFARGYRFAEDLSPAITESVEPTAHASDLERYFDGHATGPGIFKWRHYFDIYDRHLSRFRGRDVSVVEIGVAGGGSLGMWRDYLGPSAEICGVDVDPSCRRFADEGIEIVIGDQSDRSFWTRFLEGRRRPDIVIDDGGHMPEQQVVTLESLLPEIQPGGVYLCEDIHGAFQPFHSYIDGLTRPLSAIGFVDQPGEVNALQLHVDSVHRYPLMVVIEKPGRSRAVWKADKRGTEWPGE